MTWVAWRLQRTELLIVAGILALLAALLIPTGIQMANAYHNDGIAACLGANPSTACALKVGNFQVRFTTINVLANWFTLVPGIIGVVLAAPFILDLEHGTYRLAWTQSITRRRWLSVKLGLPVAAGVVAAGALILLMTWWRTPLTHINGRFDTGTYDTTGTVAIGYTLFALGLAIALGALWRRAATALTVAFVGYFAMRIFTDYWLRNHLVSPLHASWRGTGIPHFLRNANILSQTITVNGRVVSSFKDNAGVLGGHAVSASPTGGNAVFHAVYEPASFFWMIQLRETAVFAGIGLLLILAAAWWTNRRIA